MKASKPKKEADAVTTGAEIQNSVTTVQGSIGTQGKSPARIAAEALLCPHFVNGETARAFSLDFEPKLDFVELGLVIHEKIKRVQSGDLSEVESILMSHAITLNSIFNSLARNAAMNLGQNPAATDTYLRNAFRAQGQCRATLQTLAEIKNPHPLAFVKQANIAHGPQQVINEAPAVPASRARTCEENPIRSNELLEADHGQRLDPGATRTTSGIDPNLETVGAIDRPSD